MNPPRIQLLVFESLQANVGAEFVRQLVETFADEAPTLVLQLRRAALARDAESFETFAHALKGNGIAFGAARLADMAARLEWQGLDTDAGAIDQLAAELAAAVAELRVLAQR